MLRTIVHAPGTAARAALAPLVRPLSSATGSQSAEVRRARDSYASQLFGSSGKYAMLKGQRALTGENVDCCVKIFDLAASSPLPMFLLGASHQVWVPTLMRNFGITSVSALSDKTLKMALGNPKWADPSTLTDPREVAAAQALVQESQGLFDRSGAVLFEVLLWSIAANDAAILGAIAARKEIHVTVPNGSVAKIDPKHLFDSTEGRPSVLSRELTILADANFRRVDHAYPELGTILMADPTLPHSLELPDLLNRLRTIDSYEKVVAAISPLDAAEPL